MDAVERGTEIQRARAERVVGAAGHVGGKARLAAPHRRRRRPTRPLALRRHALRSAPGHAVAADADAVAQRLAVAEYQVQPPLGGIDDDGAGRIIAHEIHGGALDRVDLDEIEVALPLPEDEVIALDEALDRLAKVDQRSAEVVQLRFFVGLTQEEVAGELGMSLRTVERLWKFARAWLFRELSQ